MAGEDSQGMYSHRVLSSCQIGIQPPKMSNEKQKQTSEQELSSSKQGSLAEDTKALKRELLNTHTKEIVTQFCDHTTAHGWGKVSWERNIIIKSLWILLTLSAYALNGIHVTSLVTQYLSYPTEQISAIDMASIEFPSVTVCNIQPMSFTSTDELLQNESSNIYKWDKLTRKYLSNITEETPEGIDVEIMSNRLRQPIGVFENIGDEALIVGHRPLDFINRCTFGTNYCQPDNFTFFQSPTYYNCYTFNGGNVSDEALVTRTSGPREGLSLILYLESDNGDLLYNGTYFTYSNVGNAAGVRVVVHPKDTRPSPVDHGFDIPPGYTSSVGLKVINYKRLGDPFGSCIKEAKWRSEKYVYTSHTCLTLCQQGYVMDTCKCVSSILPIPENNESNLMYCGTLDVNRPDMFYSNLTCEAESLQQFATNESLKSHCGCHPPCSEYEYDARISYSYWPLDFVQQSFYEQFVLEHSLRDELKAYQNLGQFNVSDLIQLGLIRKNFVRLNVYLEDLTVQEYAQSQTYEFSNLFSDIGGTFGLWIGVSVITWCEILEMLTRVVMRWCRKLTLSGQLPDTRQVTDSTIINNNSAFSATETN